MQEQNGMKVKDVIKQKRNGSQVASFRCHITQ